MADSLSSLPNAALRREGAIKRHAAVDLYYRATIKSG
jgi:hypothetical protein